MNAIEMRSSRRNTRPRATVLLVLWAACGFVMGCSGEGQRAPAVDPPRARDALRAALDSWKKGDKVDALKSASPPIVIQDFDWMAGKLLVKYEVVGDGKYDDANLRIPVKLTLRTSDGQEIEKKVSYVVGTSPTLTVFRDFH